MTEIWKPIPGYVGKYEVSNLGNVRSVDHVLYQKDSHGGMMEKHYKGKPVAITDNGNGYKIVSLSNFGRKNHYVHRIVAEAFVENPNGYAVVNHLDYDTSNNAAENLEWTTSAENNKYSAHRMRHPRGKYKKSASGEKYIGVKNARYRLCIGHGGVSIDRTFKTLEEAVAKRNEVISSEKYFAG